MTLCCHNCSLAKVTKVVPVNVWRLLWQNYSYLPSFSISTSGLSWFSHPYLTITQIVGNLMLQSWGGVSRRQNVTWGGPILSHFLPIFGFWKFLQVFDISGGQKTLFFKKCPNNGLVSEKKYIEKFFIVGGGVRPKYEKFHTFIFFLNEGFPYYEKFFNVFFFWN